MAGLTRFQELTDDQKIVVTIAVLLDGFDAAEYLRFDSIDGERLASAAKELSVLTPPARMQYAGTELRSLLGKISALGKRND